MANPSQRHWICERSQRMAILELTLFIVCGLTIMGAQPALAQTFTVLYNFTGGSDGANLPPECRSIGE